MDLSEPTAGPPVRGVFDAALHLRFRGVFVLAVLTFATTWFMSAGRPIGDSRPKPDAVKAISHRSEFP